MPVSKNGPLRFFGGDIVCLGSSLPERRLAMVLGIALLQVDRSSIGQIVIAITEHSLSRLGGPIILGRSVASLLANARLETAVEALVRVVLLPNHNTHEIVREIGPPRPKSIIVVIDAAQFRSESVRPFISENGPGAPTLPEDFWVPQIHNLAQEMTCAYLDQEVYFALDAGELGPSRPELLEMLKSIDGVGLSVAVLDGDTESVIAAKVDQWMKWAADGQVGRALQGIDALPESLNSEKPILRIQLLHHAGLHGQALAELAKLQLAENGNPFVFLKLARIASDAGAGVLAARLLKSAAPRLTKLEDLASALNVSSGIDDPTAEQTVVDRLARLFPGSATLRSSTVRREFSRGNYVAAAAAMAPEQSDQAIRALYEDLGHRLSCEAMVDYLGIRRDLLRRHPEFSDKIDEALVRDALRRGLFVHAFEMAVSKPPLPRWRARTLLEIVERILLNPGKDNALLVEEERVSDAMGSAVAYLAIHPDDGHFRVSVARLLEHQVAGRLGLAIIAVLCLNAFRRPISPKRTANAPGWLLEDLIADKEFLKRAMDWLASESPADIGRIRFPSELLPSASADELLPSFEKMLIGLGGNLDTEGDLQAFSSWLAIGVSIARIGSDPVADLGMIGLAANLLVQAGRAQQARDYAEMALLYAGEPPARQRIAWSVFGDVYRRAGNRIEALVAFTCCGMIGDEVELDELWKETYALAGVFRDIRLFELALATIRKAASVLDELGCRKENQVQLDLFELQVALGVHLSSGENDSETWEVLLETAAEIAEGAFESGGDVGPAATMLGQIAVMSADAGVEQPSTLAPLLEKLSGRLEGGMAALVRATISPNPTSREVFELHRSLERSRYSEDAGFDANRIVPSAKRLLRAAAEAGDGPAAALATELLADRAIAAPGWEATAEPPPLLNRPDEPATVMAALSKDNVAIAMLAQDSSRRLVVTIAENGVMGHPFVQPSDVFSSQAFAEWSKEFPYRYGIDPTHGSSENSDGYANRNLLNLDQANLFFTTTAQLGISNLPTGRVVVVAENALQQLPPNLIWTGTEFAGFSRAMASAPSLSWLQIAREKPLKTDGNIRAWISAEAENGGTLASVAGWLEEAFAEHAVLLNTDPALPTDMIGSKMAIVVAHGSVGDSGQYFHRISDEGHLRVLARELADSLRNVGVVVLFVCSGGRYDKHPAANTTIGLAKQLLDRGCATVIGTPWPIDSTLAVTWLPQFLSNWQEGQATIDAVHHANKEVGRATGYDPAKYLALTVFGDPFRTSADG